MSITPDIVCPEMYELGQTTDEVQNETGTEKGGTETGEVQNVIEEGGNETDEVQNVTEEGGTGTGTGTGEAGPNDDRVRVRPNKMVVRTTLDRQWKLTIDIVPLTEDDPMGLNELDDDPVSPNEGSGQEVVDEDPTEDYPPLLTRQKVNNNIEASSRKLNNVDEVVVTSRNEFPNTKKIEPVAEPFNVLMKVPKLDDAIIQEQINLAKLQLDDKTRLKDSIQLQIQDKKDNTQIHRLNCESAKDECNKAKILLKSKLKQLREKSSEDDFHLKILRKELQIIKEIIVKATEDDNESEAKCDSENVKVKQLQVKFRAVNDACQAAYAHLQSLKKKLSTKNQHFFRYKDDVAFANNHKCNNNTTALTHLCTDQVEKLMQLWNTNDEFRRDYVRSNRKSTIHRLGTLDGRSRGPGEKPPVLDLAPKISTTVKNVPKRTDEHENRKVTIRKPALNEAELTKKAEEMVKNEEKAEAKLKEQQRLDELAKAEMASEKKMRKLRKKEKKKAKAVIADAMDVDNDVSNFETAAAETSNYDDESTVVPKKAQMSRPLTKALSVLPALLRSRAKQSHRQLAWTGLIGLFLYSIMAREY
ncbi:hypothetical protein CASFOL_038679 [Castilleja foliolosa]|uniref:Uncharacterized protein n=1 Tax=Castilleja foliolosa TaxID=1961234 RepID=A0ABD3BLM5_9LAMI